MVTDATKRYRDALAYALVAVAALYFIGALSLLVKSTAGAGFATKSAYVGTFFQAPVPVLSLVIAVALVTRLGELSPRARLVILAALGIGGLDLLFALITFFAQFGASGAYGYAGVSAAGKVVGAILGLAQLLFLGAAVFYFYTAFVSLPAPVAPARSWTGQGFAPYGPAGAQSWGSGGQPGQQGQQGYAAQGQGGWPQQSWSGQEQPRQDWPHQQWPQGAGYGWTESPQGQSWSGQGQPEWGELRGWNPPDQAGWGEPDRSAWGHPQASGTSDWQPAAPEQPAPTSWATPAEPVPTDEPVSADEPAPPAEPDHPADSTAVFTRPESGSGGESDPAEPPSGEETDRGEERPSSGWWQHPGS